MCGSSWRIAWAVKVTDQSYRLPQDQTHMRLNPCTSPLNYGWLARIIVSGSQTGADRAALDWACHHHIEHGGWCPKGCLAANGVLPIKYQLTETESAGYWQRTKLNVQDSEATLIFNLGVLDGGTLQTMRFARTMRKPCRIFQLDEAKTSTTVLEVVAWLQQGQYHRLNIAGPREGSAGYLLACFGGA